MLNLRVADKKVQICIRSLKTNGKARLTGRAGIGHFEQRSR